MGKPLQAEQAAELAGLTREGLRYTTSQDDPPLKGANGFPCKEFGQWLKRRHLRGIGVTVDGVKYDLDTEKARLTHHQANIAALNEEVARGNLIPADQVEAAWQDMISNARARLLTVPTRMASVFSQHVQGAARAIVIEVLEELRNDGKPREGDSVGDSRLDPPADPDGERVGKPEAVPKRRGQRRARKIPN